MKPRCILTDYLTAALEQAEYDRLDDGSYSGRIPACVGVIAFATTLAECQAELRSVLEDWLLVGLKLGHPIPVLAAIDLNQEPVRESLEPMQA
jgi:predicted RNase H-like HicB family nuclease